MKLEKGKEVTPDLLIDAFNDLEDQLSGMKGSVGEIGPFIAQMKDFQKRFDEIASRASAHRGLKLNVSKDDFAKSGFEILHKAPTGIRRTAALRWDAPDLDDPIGQFQVVCDKMYLVAAKMKLLRGEGLLLQQDVKHLKFYQREFLPALEKMQSVAKEAFDTADAGAGLEWVPTEMSTRLIERIRLELRVAALFEEIPLPRGKMDIPAWLNDLVMYRVPQRTDDGFNASTTGRMPDMLGAINFTGKISFDCEKFGGIVFTSKEQEEDSVIAMLPILDRGIVQAGGDAVENAVINGDTAATQDSDVTAAGQTDVRTAWDGLRKYALSVSGAHKDAGANAIDTDDKWNQQVRYVKGQMGKYGVNPARFSRIASPIGENQIGGCPRFATLYAMGGMATNQGGAASNGLKPDGVVMIVSEFQREDLNAAGVYDGVTIDRTSILTVHHDAWLHGVVRGMRIEYLTERFAELDLDALKVTSRRDFQAALAGKHTGITYNIQTAA